MWTIYLLFYSLFASSLLDYHAPIPSEQTTQLSARSSDGNAANSDGDNDLSAPLLPASERVSDETQSVDEDAPNDLHLFALYQAGADPFPPSEILTDAHLQAILNLLGFPTMTPDESPSESPTSEGQEAP